MSPVPSPRSAARAFVQPSFSVTLARMRRSAAFALSGVPVLAVAVVASAPAPEPPLPSFLRKVIQLKDHQIAAMERGEVVTTQLATAEKAEIAAFGIVRVRGTSDALLEKVLGDLEAFRRVRQVPEIGLFGDPPRVEDLAGLSLEDADLDALKRCKPGRCDVKANETALTRLQDEVAWSAPDGKAKATAVVKELMVEYVRAYRAGGTDAMGVIVDKEKPRALSTEFRTLLQSSRYLFEYVPAFNQYLEDYPKGKLTGTKDILYWTKDTFGLKPVVSIYHASVHEPEGTGVTLLLSNKRIYASHYFNAGLEIAATVEAPDAKARPAFYLLTLNRTRIDPPTGMLSGIVLGKVRGGLEQGVSESLRMAKAKMEDGK